MSYVRIQWFNNFINSNLCSDNSIFNYEENFLEKAERTHYKMK